MESPSSKLIIPLNSKLVPGGVGDSITAYVINY